MHVTLVDASHRGSFRKSFFSFLSTTIFSSTAVPGLTRELLLGEYEYLTELVVISEEVPWYSGNKALNAPLIQDDSDEMGSPAAELSSIKS